MEASAALALLNIQLKGDVLERCEDVLRLNAKENDDSDDMHTNVPAWRKNMGADDGGAGDAAVKRKYAGVYNLDMVQTQ